MRDPIVEEIRNIRHEMDKKADYDFDKYVGMLKENALKRKEVLAVKQ